MSNQSQAWLIKSQPLKATSKQQHTQAPALKTGNFCVWQLQAARSLSCPSHPLRRRRRRPCRTEQTARQSTGERMWLQLHSSGSNLVVVRWQQRFRVFLLCSNSRGEDGRQKYGAAGTAKSLNPFYDHFQHTSEDSRRLNWVKHLKLSSHT